MVDLRSYGDPCGIARALDVVGERWALLIVRELAFGPKRFTDLHQGLGGASRNVLSQRLRELERRGVVERHKTGAPSYELSAWGKQLRPILVQLGRWGAQSSAPPEGALSVDALLLALEATFVPARAGDLHASYALRLGEARFSVAIEAGSIRIARGAPAHADASIGTDAATLRALVFGDRKLADAALELQGDKRLARVFFRLFARPEPRAKS